MSRKAHDLRETGANSRPDGGHPKVLNAEHLSQYSLGNRALESELLELFKLQLDQQVTALHQANDEDGWYMAAHTIKGGALGLGAEQIAEIAESLEDVGFDGDRHQRSLLLTQLDAAVVAYKAAIAQR